MGYGAVGSGQNITCRGETRGRFCRPLGRRSNVTFRFCFDQRGFSEGTREPSPCPVGLVGTQDGCAAELFLAANEPAQGVIGVKIEGSDLTLCFPDREQLTVAGVGITDHRSVAVGFGFGRIRDTLGKRKQLLPFPGSYSR